MIVEEPRDKPPRAVVSPAGPRDVFLPDSSVVLDASQSSDDNGIKTYNWSIAAKPPGKRQLLFWDKGVGESAVNCQFQRCCFL